MIQGFRKVDPDRWEFANEGFLGGQKHLLKNIKRRRNIAQTSQQQHETGACVELGQFGLETEADRLRRDCNVLMAEVMKLKQQQQNSQAQLFAMEERIQGTERKQQQTMAFLGRALKNPIFVQQLILRMEQKKQFVLGLPADRRRLRRTTLLKDTHTQNWRIELVLPSFSHSFIWEEICLLYTKGKRASASKNPGLAYKIYQFGSVSKKRRLPANLSSQHPQATEAAEIELEVESLFSTMNNDSSGSSNMFQKDEVVSESSDQKSETTCELMWEELLDEDLHTGTEVVGGGQAEIGAGMERLGTKHWGEDVEGLVEHMVFLGSKP